MAGSILRYILLGGLAEDTGCRADPAFSSSLKKNNKYCHIRKPIFRVLNQD